MNPKDIRDWLWIIVTIGGYIVSGAVVWVKLTNKVNGLGGRVDVTEESGNLLRGRVDRIERELAEYRHDVQDAGNRMGRVEKAVDDVVEAVNQGNLQLGSQLHAIEKLIHDKDGRTRERLVRIETVAQIEKKLGRPIIDD